MPADIVRILTRCLSAVQATTFIAMASKRSNSNAEQPLEKTTAIAPDSSSLPDSSAARPASKAGGPAELLNLQECKNWLQALPSREILQNKPLQRLQEVMDLLQRTSSREQRKEIQNFLAIGVCSKKLKAASGSTMKQKLIWLKRLLKKRIA